MPVYSIPSKKDIENYLDEYETEGMSKEILFQYIKAIIERLQDFIQRGPYYYMYCDLDYVFSFVTNYGLKEYDIEKPIEYKTFIKNVIPFLVLNDICRV